MYYIYYYHTTLNTNGGIAKIHNTSSTIDFSQTRFKNTIPINVASDFLNPKINI